MGIMGEWCDGYRLARAAEPDRYDTDLVQYFGTSPISNRPAGEWASPEPSVRERWERYAHWPGSRR